MFFRSLCSILLTTALWAASGAGATDQEDFTWLLSYRDKGENALALDPRFGVLLQSHLPVTRLPAWSNEPVNKAAVMFLRGVPGYVEVEHGRYFAASGCPAHACVARALLWIDIQDKTVFFVSTGDEQANQAPATRDQYRIASAKLFIATNGAMTTDQLPDELRAEIIRWLHLQGVLSLSGVTLLTSSGSQPTTTDELCWTGRCSSIAWNY